MAVLNIIDVGGKQALISLFGIGGAWVWFITLTIGVMLFMVLMVIMVFTGGITFPFLMAKFRRRPIIAILRKDKRIVMGAVDYNQGMASTKKHGEFIVQPESVYSWPTGVLGFLAYADYGTSLPIDFVRATNTLKDNDFSDYDQVEKYDKELKKKDAQDQLKVRLQGTTHKFSDPMLTAPKKKGWFGR